MKNKDTTPAPDQLVDQLAKARKKYYGTPKGKQSLSRYDKSEKGKETHRKYRDSEKGKQAQLRYRLSEKGIETAKRRRLLNQLLTQCASFLKENPGATPEDFLKLLEEE